MRSSWFVDSARLRAALFAVCVACTLWLLVQNAILFTVLPWHDLLATLTIPGQVVRAAIVALVILSLLPVAFALGWWIARRAAVAPRQRGVAS